MDEIGFLLDDIAFPLTTATAEFALDDFQWDLTVVVAPSPAKTTLVVPAFNRTLVVASIDRILVVTE